MARLPRMEGVALDVRRALASRIGGGDTRIQTIARTLAMSARSLQRRLAVAGVSYQQLLDLARKDAAERYLTDSLLSIGEVAYLLGYSEPAAFNRAFRRWHKETPQAFRRRQRFEHGNTSPNRIDGEASWLLRIGHGRAPLGVGTVSLRHVAGAWPTSFLNARLNAASDS